MAKGFTVAVVTGLFLSPGTHGFAPCPPASTTSKNHATTPLFARPVHTDFARTIDLMSPGATSGAITLANYNEPGSIENQQRWEQRGGSLAARSTSLASYYGAPGTVNPRSRPAYSTYSSSVSPRSDYYYGAPGSIASEEGWRQRSTFNEPGSITNQERWRERGGAIAPMRPSSYSSASYAAPYYGAPGSFYPRSRSSSRFSSAVSPSNDYYGAPGSVYSGPRSSAYNDLYSHQQFGADWRRGNDYYGGSHFNSNRHWADDIYSPGSATRGLTGSGSRVYWPTPAGSRSSQLTLSSGRYGGPLEANVEVWRGPNDTPQRVRTWSMNGSRRPFQAMMRNGRGAPGIVQVRNGGPMEFPFQATVGSETPGLGPASMYPRGPSHTKNIQGGSLSTFPIDASVDRVHIHLESDGLPVMALVEVLQGPNTVHQVADVYTEDGRESPFTTTLELNNFEWGRTGCTLSIRNQGTLEFPIRVIIEPEYAYAPSSRGVVAGGYSLQDRLLGGYGLKDRYLGGSSSFMSPRQNLRRPLMAPVY